MGQESVDKVKELYVAFRMRDLEAIFGLLSSDFLLTVPTDLPWGGVYRGHDQFRIFMGKLFAHVKGVMNFEQFLDAGSTVVAIGRTSGRLLRNDGYFDEPFVNLWRVRDGQLVAMEAYIDVPKMLSAE